MSSLLPDPGASLLDRIKTSMVGLKMPRALEMVDSCVGRLDHGEITALEAIDKAFNGKRAKDRRDWLISSV